MNFYRVMHGDILQLAVLSVLVVGSVFPVDGAHVEVGKRTEGRGRLAAALARLPRKRGAHGARRSYPLPLPRPSGARSAR